MSFSSLSLSESRPNPASIADHTCANLLAGLSAALEQRFGLYPNALMETKLKRLLGIDTSSENIASTSYNHQALSQQISELQRLPAQHPRWLALVAQLTVHETYFFRDQPQLMMLHDNIFPQLIEIAAQKKQPKIRIWSAACSTGEEVYSLAILLLDALRNAGYAYGSETASVSLMPGWQVEVLGTDISTSALQIAADAHYADENMGSFRRLDSQWQQWFEPTGKPSEHFDSELHYRQPKNFVRKITRFGQHNMLHNPAPLGSFDLVICRNALIYFQDSNKRIVEQHFLSALQSNGFLVLGAADPMLCPELTTQFRAQRLPYFVKNKLAPSLIPEPTSLANKS